MLKFTIDIMERLKEKGFTTYKIRKENLFGQKTLQDIKSGIVPGIKTIDILCGLLEIQPGDFIEYIPDDERTE